MVDDIVAIPQDAATRGANALHLEPRPRAGRRRAGVGARAVADRGLEVTPTDPDAIRGGGTVPTAGVRTRRQHGLELAAAGVLSKGDVLRVMPEDA